MLATHDKVVFANSTELLIEETSKHGCMYHVHLFNSMLSHVYIFNFIKLHFGSKDQHNQI